jgi:hypothetical protein
VVVVVMMMMVVVVVVMMMMMMVMVMVIVTIAIAVQMLAVLPIAWSHGVAARGRRTDLLRAECQLVDGPADMING